LPPFSTSFTRARLAPMSFTRAHLAPARRTVRPIDPRFSYAPCSSTYIHCLRVESSVLLVEVSAPDLADENRSRRPDPQEEEQPHIQRAPARKGDDIGWLSNRAMYSVCRGGAEGGRCLKFDGHTEDDRQVARGPPWTLPGPVCHRNRPPPFPSDYRMVMPDVYSTASSTDICWLSPANSLSSVRKSMQWHSCRSRIGTHGQFQ